MRAFLSTFSEQVHLHDILILAVSGGVDSMVLLDLVLQVHPKENIVIAHYDHGLRGNDSLADMFFVRSVSERLGIDFASETSDISALAKEHKSSIEATARHARYAFLERIRQEYDAKYILTAHHADDQVETMILNLVKGGKSQGLSGMQQLTGSLFRPLLQETKADIIAYAKTRDISYHEDLTNQDTRFERNKIRHHVVPILLELNPSLHRTFSHLSLYSEEVQSHFSQTAQQWLRSEEEQIGTVSMFSGGRFAELDPLMQREVIAYLYRRAHAGSAQGLSTSLIREVIRFITERSNSHGVKEIKKLHLERRGERIRISL